MLVKLMLDQVFLADLIQWSLEEVIFVWQYFLQRPDISLKNLTEEDATTKATISIFHAKSLNIYTTKILISIFISF